MKLWERLYPENPLASMQPCVETDIQGWNSYSPAFEHVIAGLKPKLIIEVGSWKGASALHMAALCDAEILCIDTWLGSVEMWNHQDPHQRYMFDSLMLRHGWPHLYYTFASNVIRQVGRERICPLPLPSSVAAQLLRRHRFQADLIYVDGSHDYRDVHNDLEDFWPLVRPGGVLLGDDWCQTGVQQAAREVLPGVQAIFDKYVAQKPLT